MDINSFFYAWINSVASQFANKIHYKASTSKISKKNKTASHSSPTTPLEFKIFSEFSENLLHVFIQNSIGEVEFSGTIHVDPDERCRAGFLEGLNKAKVFFLNEFIWFKKYEQLEQSSFIDDLTKVYNRKFFQKKMSQLTLSPERRSCLLVLLDLNYFKNINDSFGHLKGDQVLFAFAQNLELKLRRSDIVCRWGGDEFLCLFENVSEKKCQEILSRVFSKPFHCDDLAIDVEYSVGYLHLTKTQLNAMLNLESLIAKLDQKLYDQKRKKERRQLFNIQ